MKFKSGDLVILVRAENPLCKQYLGHVLVLGHKDWRHATDWHFSPELVAADNLVVIWHENDMRRIDNHGDDATDEVIQRIGKPEGVSA